MAGGGQVELGVPDRRRRHDPRRLRQEPPDPARRVRAVRRARSRPSRAGSRTCRSSAGRPRCRALAARAVADRGAHLLRGDPPGVRPPHGARRRARTSWSRWPTTPGSATRRSRGSISALARLRAVEQRRFLVRSTNSGVSAVVDPDGPHRRADRPPHAREPARDGPPARRADRLRAARRLARLAGARADAARARPRRAVGARGG